MSTKDITGAIPNMANRNNKYIKNERVVQENKNTLDVSDIATKKWKPNRDSNPL
jgi:hypothetical protein